MQALIFDFDGLILDTEMPDYLSWQQVYHSYGVELPLEKWVSIVGGNAESDFEPHDHLEKLTGCQVDREQIWISRRKSYMDTLESQVIMPGVEAYLQDAERLGLKVAVASSSPENWVAGHLTRLGLMERFAVVCTANDVTQIKPKPDLFLLTAARLGVPPEQVIVFEDSTNGVLAGRRAGMYVVAVPTGVTAHLDFSAADLRLGSLAEIDLETLLAKARNHG